MKKRYEKPMLAVEHFSLTQAIAGCVLKIKGTGSSRDVLADPDATNQMKSLASAGGFISAGGCLRPLDGYTETGKDGDMICYHGPISAAFPS